MNEKSEKNLNEKLDRIIELLQQLIALELSKRGATHQAIGKSVKVAKSTVGKMLAGIKDDPSNGK